MKLQGNAPLSDYQFKIAESDKCRIGYFFYIFIVETYGDSLTYIIKSFIHGFAIGTASFKKRTFHNKYSIAILFDNNRKMSCHLIFSLSKLWSRSGRKTIGIENTCPSDIQFFPEKLKEITRTRTCDIAAEG